MGHAYTRERKRGTNIGPQDVQTQESSGSLDAFASVAGAIDAKAEFLRDELRASVRKIATAISQNMSGIQRNYNCMHKPWSGRATVEKMTAVGNHSSLSCFLDCTCF